MIMRESYLLKKVDKMIIYDNEYQPSGCGTIPEKRDIERYINHDVVVDKKTNLLMKLIDGLRTLYNVKRLVILVHLIPMSVACYPFA
ncbi:hypothetical protein A0H76_644 [Hepatospora eriocheir]|uniref:Dyskerin-like domain-containing protein n=1 Tax=Hepatospora eriocheir TaxID=1081669 RepID=A0A1X0Q7L7_9MICR|nr:hypothetical protein A0H76_644 [Hepatospora eriocheir]